MGNMKYVAALTLFALAALMALSVASNVYGVVLTVGISYAPQLLFADWPRNLFFVMTVILAPLFFAGGFAVLGSHERKQ